jgi:phi13 family phage major tail protein
MSTVTGIEKVYIAVNTRDDASTLTYGVPVYYEGIKELGIKPKTNNVKLYAENKLWDQSNSFDSADVDIILASLSSLQRATLLGQTIAAIGGVYATDDDSAPYVAILYKANIRGGFRYGVLYKGMFALPEDTAKGQEGKLEFQTPKISAVFQSTVYEITGQDGNKKGVWEYHVDTIDPNCPVDIEANWFTSVTVPTLDIVAPTLTSVPANNATGVAVGAVVVITFNKAMDESTITLGNIFLMTAAGVLAACALTLDAAKKIATLTPVSNLSAGVYLVAITNDVKSATGVAIANTSVIKFTV